MGGGIQEGNAIYVGEHETPGFDSRQGPSLIGFTLHAHVSTVVKMLMLKGG
jgi:hypothetical protein